MFTIGEFAKLCDISTKTLRYYDKINLLKPAKIDVNNDYRYYDVKQLKDILLINKLKNYSFSLEEICIILDKKDTNYLMEELQKKIVTIEEEIKSKREKVFNMKNDIEKVEDNGKFLGLDDVNPSVIEVEDINIVSIRKLVKEKEIGNLFNDLGDIIKENKLKVYDSPITIWHGKEYNENKLIDMEVAIPVHNDCGENIRVLKGGKFIYAKHIGDYEKLRALIIKLHIWKEENGYEICGPIYGKYVKGIHNSDNPKEYVTEIYLPIK